MIELPGWNDLISVNGFCYSSSMGESPKLNIPLKTSVAPTKGIAPATFNRNSTATYIDANGVLQTAAIDVPRFQNGRYLVEPAATNLALYSNSMDSWSLSSCTLTPNYAIAPDNTLTADKVTITGQYAHVHQLVSGLTAGETYTFSLWLKNIDFDEVITLYVSNSASTLSYLNTTINITGEWVRYSGSFTLPSDITSVRIRAVRAISETFGGSLLVWGAQLEAKALATSYIPTTTVAATRAADALHYDVSSVITQGQGSLYCEFVGVPASGVIKTVLTLSDNTYKNRLYSYIAIDGTIILKGVTEGVSALTLIGSVILPTLNKTLVTYTTGETKFYLNGVLIGTATMVLIPNALSKLSTGCSRIGSEQLNSEIGNVKYFKEVLTEAESIKLTTV